LASSTIVRYMLVCALVAVAFFSWVSADSGGGHYEAYTLRYKEAADVEAQLVDLLRHLTPKPHVVADPRDNQLLVRGSEAAHQIAKQFIQSVDRPPVAQTRPQSAPFVNGYHTAKDRLAETAARLHARYAARGDVRVTTDAGTSQILVLAPADVHRAIASELTSPAVMDTPTPARRTPAPRQQFAEQTVRLSHVPIDRFEHQFRQLLGSRLEPVRGAVAGQPNYVFVKAARRVEVTVDRQRGHVRLAGDQSVVAQLARLTHALDILENSGRELGATTRIVPVHRADPAKVREAVDAYRTGTTRLPARLAPPASGGMPATNDTSRNRSRPRMPIALVQHAEPAGGAAQPNGVPGAGQIPTTEEELAEEEQRQEAFRQLGDNVEIETLPDLDVIILRGRDHEVDEVARIIAEIERLSEETVPEIDIYQLRHVHCMSLVTIIDLVATDLIGGRQGKIHVTPLVKPNALLLVGWGEAVAAMKELIAKLDQPVAPESQIRVYRLRHAGVAEAQTVLEDAFADPQGLGPAVSVTADLRTNSLIVRASPRDLAEVDHLISRLDQGDSGIVNQAQIFKLENTLAMDLATTLQSAITAAGGGPGGQRSAVLELLTADVRGQRLLRSGVLSDVQITPDPHTNSLMVAAPAESMDLLAELIEQLDSPTGVAQIKVFEILNGDANSLIEMLRILLPAEAMVAGPQLAGAEGEGTLVPVRFSVDTRTNSIIATGSQGDLAIIEALLLRLDQQDVEQRKNQVYRLRNAPALDVALAINEFLRSERQLQQEAAGVVSPFEQIEREVVVVPEPVSNSLILSATPRFFEEIMTLVEEIDKQPDQVLIQVVIAEVVLEDYDEFGIEMGLQDSVLFDRSLLSDLDKITRTITSQTPGGATTTVQEDIVVAATNTPGFAFNNNDLGNAGSDKAFAASRTIGGQGLSHFALGRLSAERGYGGMLFSASSDSVSVLIRALQHLRTLQVLGRPQIMTLDNQSAFIQVGQRVPRISGSRFDGRTQTNNVELENTGLILGVTPRISPDGMVVMEIDAEKSQLGSENEGVVVSVVEGMPIRSPTIDVTMAQTTVSAANGETIILGGLITKRTEMIRRRVPYLSNIPLLGDLFRYDSDDVVRAELLIFLTPLVMGVDDDFDRIKQAEAARMNWSLADIHDIHGPTGLYQDEDTYLHGQGEVIYPDTNPHGLTPGEFRPRAVPLEDLELSPPIEHVPTPADEPNPDADRAPAANDLHSRWDPAPGVVPTGYSTPSAPYPSPADPRTERWQPPPRETAPNTERYR